MPSILVTYSNTSNCFNMWTIFPHFPPTEAVNEFFVKLHGNSSPGKLGNWNDYTYSYQRFMPGRVMTVALHTYIACLSAHYWVHWQL